jgi:DNA-binding MarR family transcriptional regulator
MSSAFELLQTMGRVPRPQQEAVAEQGIREGRWTRDQVAAFFDLPERETRPKERRPRVPAVTRRVRLSRRRCSFSRYVRRFSIDVLVHPGLSTGAVTTLVYLISRCGRHRQLRTCTSWLAADLGVSPRTIQNHYRQLEQAGFLVRSSPDRFGRTTIYLTDLVEVRPVQKDAAQSLAHQGDRFKRKGEISRPKKKPGSRSVRAV